MAAPKVLIVDDEIIIARELEARLRNLGYDVPGIASSGREAIRLAEETAPDLVLMDIVLKGDMDGVEAAAEIRRRWSLPVVYLTAYTDEATLRRARVTEPYGYIVKPFSERELRANIEMALYKHQAESRLRKVERWFTTSMERVGDGVLAADRHGVVTFLNREAEALTGWGRAEAVGRPAQEILSLVSRAAQAPIRDAIPRALDEGIVTHLGDETLLVNREGAATPVDVTAACVRDDQGKGTGVVLVLRDLSERSRLQEALRESEERFRLLVAGVRDYAIFMLDPEGRVVTWNAGAERIKGYRPEEIVGQHFSRFYPQEAIDRGWPEEELRRAVAEGRFVDEGWRVRKDGSTFWANVVITALKNQAGDLLGFSKVTRDLTERREFERQLQRHAEELERQVEERTRELRDANTALEAFGYSVSHDLRTPVRNMQSLAQALEEDYADKLDEGGRDFCRRITAAARKMDTLINDLLAYSRLSRSDLPLARVDLDGVLAEVRGGLAEVIRDRQAQVEVKGPLPPVVGHRPTLVQVVTNLLSNAVKFASPGVPPRVRVRAEDRGDCVRLWVEDNGIGIAPEHRDRIFKVFERLHGEESYPGTGIGLAIVRKGIERTGGRAGVEPGDGGGSRFWVELPKPKGGK